MRISTILGLVGLAAGAAIKNNAPAITPAAVLPHFNRQPSTTELTEHIPFTGTCVPPSSLREFLESTGVCLSTSCGIEHSEYSWSKYYTTSCTFSTAGRCTSIAGRCGGRWLPRFATATPSVTVKDSAPAFTEGAYGVDMLGKRETTETLPEFSTPIESDHSWSVTFTEWDKRGEATTTLPEFSTAPSSDYSFSVSFTDLGKRDEAIQTTSTGFSPTPSNTASSSSSATKCNRHNCPTFPGSSPTRSNTASSSSSTTKCNRHNCPVAAFAASSSTSTYSWPHPTRCLAGRHDCPVDAFAARSTQDLGGRPQRPVAAFATYSTQPVDPIPSWTQTRSNIVISNSPSPSDIWMAEATPAVKVPPTCSFDVNKGEYICPTPTPPTCSFDVKKGEYICSKPTPAPSKRAEAVIPPPCSFDVKKGQYICVKPTPAAAQDKHDAGPWSSVLASLTFSGPAKPGNTDVIQLPPPATIPGVPDFTLSINPAQPSYIPASSAPGQSTTVLDVPDSTLSIATRKPSTYLERPGQSTTVPGVTASIISSSLSKPSTRLGKPVSTVAKTLVTVVTSTMSGK